MAVQQDKLKDSFLGPVSQNIKLNQMKKDQDEVCSPQNSQIGSAAWKQAFRLKSNEDIASEIIDIKP